MSAVADVLIVGSGPAGVSAAFPLLEAGLSVCMVDGGQAATVPAPLGQFLALRAQDPQQWKWMVGDNFRALAQGAAVSPKLRTPTHAHVFEGFAAANRIEASNFVALGSLASGGLSNAWGCGVARLAPHERADWPAIASAGMDASYAVVAQRMGLSGAQADDLVDYFGVDTWADPPLPLDAVQQALWQRHRRPGRRPQPGFRLGRARVAVLAAARDGRESCDLSGNCLWGCARGALYAAGQDLARLRRQAGFDHRPGLVVTRVGQDQDGAWLDFHSSDGPGTLRARRVLLAAGTLATSRLALQALGRRDPARLQSSPTAAFLLCRPGSLGRPRSAAFGLGQLSFVLELAPGMSGFGSLFNPTGIPLAEFARFLPLRRPLALDVLAALLGACAIGNLFLPGSLGQASVRLGEGDTLLVSGGHGSSVPGLMDQAAGQLKRAFGALGSWMLPGSFRTGLPGSDIHYAATLPMRAAPAAGETDVHGTLPGLPRIHVVDAACLPSLPEKSHTLTLMANADRIGRSVAHALGRPA